MTGFVDLPDRERRIDWIRHRSDFADPGTSALLTAIFTQALRGLLTVQISDGPRGGISLEGLSGQQKVLVDARFSPDAQLRHGAQLPSTLQRARLGSVHLPRYVRQTPRVAFAAAARSPGEFHVTNTDTVLLWSFLIPAVAIGMRPFRLRADLAVEVETWRDSVADLELLGMRASGLDIIAPGSGYAACGTEEQLRRRQHALDELAEAIPADFGDRYRSLALTRVAETYFDTLRRDGTNTRKRVLTTSLAADLTVGCLGDWERFLDVLGQPLARGERIRRERIEVHAQLDLRSEGPVNDIQTRVNVLRTVWHALDEIQAKADLEEDRSPRLTRWTADDELLPMLPQEIRDAVRELWGEETDTKTIDRIVSCQSPTNRALEALSPAVDLWSTLLDAAWRIASGYYRLTRSGSLKRYEPITTALAELGVPLAAGELERILETLEAAGDKVPEGYASVGFSITIDDDLNVSTAALEKDAAVGREIFSQMRDQITEARRRWAEDNLELFLERRWRSAFEAAAEQYERKLVEREGKPPTVKQSAAVGLINLWFGGHVEPFYEFIGHPREHHQARIGGAD